MRAHLAITTSLTHCYGCGKTVGVCEFVLRDASEAVIGCKECKRSLI